MNDRWKKVETRGIISRLRLRARELSRYRYYFHPPPSTPLTWNRHAIKRRDQNPLLRRIYLRQISPLVAHLHRENLRDFITNPILPTQLRRWNCAGIISVSNAWKMNLSVSEERASNLRYEQVINGSELARSLARVNSVFLFLFFLLELPARVAEERVLGFRRIRKKISSLALKRTLFEERTFYSPLLLYFSPWTFSLWDHDETSKKLKVFRFSFLCCFAPDKTAQQISLNAGRRYDLI